MKQLLCFRAHQKERGQSLVEYALVLVLVAVVVIVILSAVGTSISGIFCSVQGALNGGSYSCGQCSPISYNDTIPAGGQLDLTMDFAQGDVVTIFAQGIASGTFDPTITLLDPSGNQVGYDDDSGQVGGDMSARLHYTVSTAGTYTLRLKEYANLGGNATGYVRCD